MGDVGTLPVKLGIWAEQLGVMPAEVAQEPLPSARAQVQREHRGAGGTRGGNLREQGIDLLVAVGDHRQYRRHHHLAGQTCLHDGANQLEPRSRRRRTRLECSVGVLIDERDGYAHADRYCPAGHGQ